MVHRARLEVHPAVVRPLAGHRAEALVVHRARLAVHPAEVRLQAGLRAVVLRAETHQAPAGHRAVAVPVVAPRAAVCRAEAREAAPAAWKGEAPVDRAMVRWQAAIQDSVIRLVAISRCPVWSMKSRSTLRHRVVAATVAVRVMAPTRAVVTRQVAAQVAPVMEIHHQGPPMERLPLTQVPKRARQAARARKVV